MKNLYAYAKSHFSANYGISRALEDIAYEINSRNGIPEGSPKVFYEGKDFNTCYDVDGDPYNSYRGTIVQRYQVNEEKRNNRVFAYEYSVFSDCQPICLESFETLVNSDIELVGDLMQINESVLKKREYEEIFGYIIQGYTLLNEASDYSDLAEVFK